MLFHGNSGYANAPRYYVVITLPVLLTLIVLPSTVGLSRDLFRCFSERYMQLFFLTMQVTCPILLLLISLIIFMLCEDSSHKALLFLLHHPSLAQTYTQHAILHSLCSSRSLTHKNNRHKYCFHLTFISAVALYIEFPRQQTHLKRVHITWSKSQKAHFNRPFSGSQC